MTLLAFYLDEDELISKKMEADHLKRADQDEFSKSLRKTIKQKKLQRRSRNNQILFNMLVIFGLKLALVWVMVLYFLEC